MNEAPCARRCSRSSSRSTTRRPACRRCSTGSILRSTSSARRTRSCSSTTAAATVRRRCCKEQFLRRPDVTRVILFNGNYGQHMAIVAGFEHCRGERVVTLDADLQNPPEEIGKLLAAMDAGPRLRRRHPSHARGLVVAARRFAGDEPGARAHHADQDDRPGLHAARLQPRHRAMRSPHRSEVSTFIPALAYTFAQQPDRGRGRACRARGRRIEIFALQADPPQLRPDHRLLAGSAADVLDVRHARFGRRARDLSHRHRRAPARWRAGARAVATLWDRDILAFFLLGMVLFGLGLRRRIRRPHLPAGARAAALHDRGGARARRGERDDASAQNARRRRHDR